MNGDPAELRRAIQPIKISTPEDSLLKPSDDAAVCTGNEVGRY